MVKRILLNKVQQYCGPGGYLSILRLLRDRGETHTTHTPGSSTLTGENKVSLHTRLVHRTLSCLQSRGSQVLALPHPWALHRCWGKQSRAAEKANAAPWLGHRPLLLRFFCSHMPSTACTLVLQIYTQRCSVDELQATLCIYTLLQMSCQHARLLHQLACAHR